MYLIAKHVHRSNDSLMTLTVPTRMRDPESPSKEKLTQTMIEASVVNGLSLSRVCGLELG